ncbi:MAG: BrnA antitoxin family protein [Candidatus Poribacteria bacterium]|nr:BrnA antitoxin family protein [Candidatus Poribacteria bacterium]MDE0504789.1 BrnA antitoxin family protein [Candidatus Poribacteria bacterium]
MSSCNLSNWFLSASVSNHPNRPTVGSDGLGWFTAQGKGYQTRMNAALRA